MNPKLIAYDIDSNTQQHYLLLTKVLQLSSNVRIKITNVMIIVSTKSGCDDSNAIKRLPSNNTIRMPKPCGLSENTISENFCTNGLFLNRNNPIKKINQDI